MLILLGQNIFIAELVTTKYCCWPALGIGENTQLSIMLQGWTVRASWKLSVKQKRLQHAGAIQELTDNSFPQGKQGWQPRATSSARVMTHGGWCFCLMRFTWWDDPRTALTLAPLALTIRHGHKLLNKDVLSMGQMFRMFWWPGLICEDLSSVATLRMWHPARKAPPHSWQSWSNKQT